MPVLIVLAMVLIPTMGTASIGLVTVQHAMPEFIPLQFLVLKTGYGMKVVPVLPLP